MIIWMIALNVWLLLVGASWRTWITASDSFLGGAAIVVVLIFVLELIYTHRNEWCERF